MKTKKTPAATKRGVVLESVVRRPRPSLFPQKVRGGITEAWYYEYADHLKFYHHDGPGKVSTFSVPLWMLQKSLARCKPNPSVLPPAAPAGREQRAVQIQNQEKTNEL